MGICIEYSLLILTPIASFSSCMYIHSISRHDETSHAGHFLRIRQWGGQLQKGTILYQVWRNDRWLLVTKILVWYRIS